ncbi:hypothetical protein I4F81_010079 [Pyropia yezoensis]|uniref:Uncharacterized protein n=1 Tax=Pyropia yezoensis TaxID=2788 RepID=A0ACC3CCM7_PYRYE|nr:hypothetical protein I4F81_010079 [Neopyropia yezoensis]
MVEGVPSPAVRRVHLAGFMLDFHARVHALRSAAKGAAADGRGGGGGDRDADVVEVVASQLAAEAGLLCVDEFQVTDVADAVVLRRLFGALFRRGVVLVATSNREPSELYVNGLARELFVPLIPLLYERTVVHRLTSPLCGRPLGTADYRALAAHFRVVCVTGLPVLDPVRNRNEARRWIHLVDALYECRVKLFVSGAAADVAGVFGGPSTATGACVTEEVFAADRTVSRLLEMRSADYMRAARVAADWRVSDA